MPTFATGSTRPLAFSKSGLPHGLDAADACPACRIAATGFLADLPRDVGAELESSVSKRHLAVDEILCAAGERARALYILRAGRVKVREAGRIVKVCRAGEVLGAGARAANVPLAVDFIAIDACNIDMIPLARARLRAVVASAVSRCVNAAHRQPREQAVVLTTETIARLARLLGDLECIGGEKTSDGVRIPMTMSLRRIGQLLAMPETAVAHILGELEARGILYVDGAGNTILTSDRSRGQSRRYSQRGMTD